MTAPFRQHLGFRLLTIMVLTASALTADAQKVFKLNRLVDSILAKKYHYTDFDTNYISRPKTKWTLTARFNMSGATIGGQGLLNGNTYEGGKPFESELRANYKSTLSVGVSYLGLSVNLSLNPAKMLGKYRDYELVFRSYGKRFGYDVAYQDASNFKGWQKLDGVRKYITTTDDMFHLRTLNVNGYFVFNHRRFSYPAAFSHSYIQHRSAGSLLLAASGQGQHGEVSQKNSIKFKMTNIGIGGGYGYNYVPAKGWMLHLSALPTFIVYTNTSLTIDDTDIPLNYHFPEVIITGRGAIVKQIGNNKFAGISAVYHYTRIGHEEDLAIRNEKWLTHLYFGFRL